MKHLSEAVRTLALTSGRLDKIALLQKYANLEGFKDVMRFIYNPYVRTGIAKAKLEKGRYNGLPQEIVDYKQAIQYFTEHQTGSDADVRYAWHFINSQDDPQAKILAMSMVTKDLKIGVTETTLNQVYGKSFIPKIGLMLGEKYNDYKAKVPGPFIVTEKLDGHRRLLVKENGVCRFYTRSGILDEGLVELEAEASMLPNDFVYDGECLAIGNFKNSLELRQATNSIMNSKGIKTGVTYNVFDMIPACKFKAGKSNFPARTRKLMVGGIFGDTSIKHVIEDVETAIGGLKVPFDFKFIKSVPILGIATNEEEILQFAKPIWERGFEGVMLNTISGVYEIKRSRELLKVKLVLSLDLPIVDFQEGEGKYAGMLGAFIIEYKGHRVGVGSGLTDYERHDYWERRNELLGVKIEIDTFGETTNQDGGISLNAPIFKGVRLDK